MILHQHGPQVDAPPLEPLSPSVRKLDALLNQRVTAALTDETQNHWLHVKVNVKRRLVRLPAELITPRRVKAAIVTVLSAIPSLPSQRVLARVVRAVWPGLREA